MIGKRFGEWTVADGLVVSHKGHKKVLCACSCGNRKMVPVSRLLSGRSNSCGCKRGGLDDLTGKKFGEWEVLYRDGASCKPVKWVCRCSCGEVKSVTADILRRGKSKTCGGRSHITLIGNKIGLLKVREEVGALGASGNFSYRCVCDCGEETVVLGSKLKNGETRSCGCLRVTAAKKHGMHKTRTYRIWNAMRQRCGNPKASAYKRYGAKGISVCDRWLYSFENFLADMGECPDGKSIDRINSLLGYEKSNCRWATQVEQMSNSSFVGASGEINITKTPNGKYVVKFRQNNRGTYSTIEEAVAARDLIKGCV